jgi:hypothetical protein
VTGSRVDDQAPHPAVRDDEQVLADAGFEQVSVIAVEAAATIYRAVQPALRRTVAVRLHHAPIPDTTAARRFAEQCAILGGLGGHPNIVEIYDCVRGAQGRPFVVMELPAGGTLAQRLDREGPLPWPEALHMAVSLAGALATAHRADVIHGAVSADHVLVSAYGPPQLGGFGRFDDAVVQGDPVQDIRDLAAVCATALGDSPGAPPAVRSLFAAAAAGQMTAEAFGRAAQRLQQQLGIPTSALLLPGDDWPAASRPATARGRRTGVLAAAGLLGAAALAVSLVLAGGTGAPAPLGIAAVAGEWEPDAALAEQLRATPDAYLCRDLEVAQPYSAQVEAYRSNATGARVGVVLRRLEPTAAGQLFGEMAAQGPCLEQLPGLTEVSAVPFDADEQGVQLHYRRPAAAAPVDIVVLAVHRSGTVGQVLHLGYPRTDPEVTQDLRDALTTAVADSADRE